MTEARDHGLSEDSQELLLRLERLQNLCWNSEKMEGPAHELIMLGYAEGRRPARHRNWYVDITPLGRAVAEALKGQKQ